MKDDTSLDALHGLAFMEECYARRTQLAHSWETSFKCEGNLKLPDRYRRILVVGASGFVGTRLVEILHSYPNVNVRATIHKAASAARLARIPIEFVDCDLLDPDQVMSAMKGCDVVVNCARDSGLNRKDIVDFHVKSTSNLLRCAELNEIGKFIQLSTAAVHDFGSDHTISETSRYVRTTDPYLRGKIESEKLVLAHQHRLPVVVLKPTMIYGPYSANWVTQFIGRLENQRPLTLRDDSLANLIYIDDVVRAILLAIESDQVDGEVFIINNDSEHISWKEYIMNISTGLGFSPRNTPDGNLLSQRIGNDFALLPRFPRSHQRTRNFN